LLKLETEDNHMNGYAVTLGVAVCLIARFAVAGDLLPPIPVRVGEEVLDVEHMGHAAPFVGDYNNDGVNDLLVGEFYKGRLRIYENAGTNSEPRFEGYRVFQDGAPSGCIFAS
jgi:hypothetical protein